MIDKKHVIDEIDPEHLVEIVEEQLEAERGIKFYWREGDPDPPWIPDRDRRYVQKMTDWVHWHLDRAPLADQEPNPPDVSKRQLELLKEDGPEIAAAERGDISPLRKKWPRFARFLHLAKREHGQRFASLPWNDHDRAKLAAIMAGEITALWQKHYVSDSFNEMTDGFLGVIERVETTNGTMIDAIAAVMLHLIDELDLDSDLDIQVENESELTPERKAVIYLEDSIKRKRRNVLTPPPESRRWSDHPRKIPKRPKPLATLPGAGIDILIKEGFEITHCSPAIGFILAEAFKGGPVYTYPVTSQGVMEPGDWYLRHPDGTIASAGTALYSSLAELEANLTKEKLAERQKFPDEPETALDRERAKRAADTRAYLSKTEKN